jgi:hypothetical protein
VYFFEALRGSICYCKLGRVVGIPKNGTKLSLFWVICAEICAGGVRSQVSEEVALGVAWSERNPDPWTGAGKA